MAGAFHDMIVEAVRRRPQVSPMPASKFTAPEKIIAEKPGIPVVVLCGGPP
jgi:hypothetical protein